MRRGPCGVDGALGFAAGLVAGVVRGLDLDVADAEAEGCEEGDVDGVDEDAEGAAGAVVTGGAVRIAALDATGTGTGTGTGAGAAMLVPIGRPRFAMTTPATTPSRPTRPMTRAPAKMRVGDDLGVGRWRPGGQALIDAPSIVRIDGPVGGPSPGGTPDAMLGTLETIGKPPEGATGPTGIPPDPFG